ncbi:MAG: bifunctional riboflavin kinase/FAD synthetase [Waddliaceae bacterium]
MKELEDLQLARELKGPTAVTLGNFDGVHKGHQSVLRKLKSEALKIGGSSVVITFSNHPSTILNSSHPTPLICTLSHRIKLLKSEGVDHVITLPFTAQLASLSPEQFLQKISPLQFQTLVLGHDARFGKDKKGDRDTLSTLAKNQFKLYYVEEVEGISSSAIRKCITTGQLVEASKLLNRPYSIYSQVTRGNSRGTAIGYPTANFDVTGLCLPPFGVYAIEVVIDSKKYPGIANLGIAPTIRTHPVPLLEVHLFDFSKHIYGQWMEVLFSSFLRPEKKFASIEDLKNQITEDIKLAKGRLLIRD